MYQNLTLYFSRFLENIFNFWEVSEQAFLDVDCGRHHDHDVDDDHHLNHDHIGGHQQVRLDVDRGRRHDATLLIWQSS